MYIKNTSNYLFPFQLKMRLIVGMEFYKLSAKLSDEDLSEKASHRKQKPIKVIISLGFPLSKVAIE